MKTEIAFYGRNIFNGPTSGTHKPYLAFKNLEDLSQPVDILIYEQIGKDWWSNEGVAAIDFVNTLKEIPKNREINVFINSPGGNVFDGLAIYNQLKARRDMVTCYVDGVAASIASIIALSGRKLIMPENALLMIHDPSGLCAGTAEEMRQMADALDVCKDSLVSVYVEKTGKPKSQIGQVMSDETWFTGMDAMDFGLCDSTSEPIDIAACLKKFDLTMFKKAPNSFVNAPNASKPAERSTQLNVMNRSQIIALLKRHNISFQDSSTDAELIALMEKIPIAQATPPTPPAPAPAPAPSNASELADIRAENKKIQDRLDKERRTRIEAQVRQHVIDNRLPGNEQEDAVTRCMADESYLDIVAKRPVVMPGHEPIDSRAEGQDSPRALLKVFGGFKAALDSWRRGNDSVTPHAIRDASISKAEFWNQHRAKLMPFMNTNTVDATLKRDAILQEIIKDFTRILMPLTSFSTVFSNVPLLGNNVVQVPFLDLDSSASTQFVEGTGYTTIGNTTIDNRPITVGTGATDGGRLFQALKFSSEEFARQPWLKIKELAQLKAEKLAYDIFQDILGIITVANYGASVKAEPASGFDSDDVIDVRLACKLWPMLGRSLFLDTDYDSNLLKDTSFKSALNAASDAALREGRVGPRVFGFDYYAIPTIPTNSENLVGFAVFKSGILVATAPVPPVQEVRAAGTMYEVVTDPQTGITFEYRSFGDNIVDTATNVIECSYGFAKGNANALKRITSQ